MTNVDQFTSMFRAATREVFQHETLRIRSVLSVTDRDADGAKAFGEQARKFLSAITAGDGFRWTDVAGDDFRTVGDLLELVASSDPDLICTYRNLHSTAWRWPYSLGTHLDVLTQHTNVPVVVLPHPEAERTAEHAMTKTSTVMAITDHLSGDNRLINYALGFTAKRGTLWLTHVEDEATFERYMEVISKIPAIDTDEARARIREQLLKGPTDYIESCAKVLHGEKLLVTIEPLVVFGHHLPEYRKLIEDQKVDLLVMNAKDEEQLAMHGVAYPLAVETRQIPLLML